MSQGLKACIRTDASRRIGGGHVMRCLTLAQALTARGADVEFLCRELPGDLSALIGAHGFTFKYLTEPDAPFRARPDDVAHADWLGLEWERDADETAAELSALGGADWLIYDHYALDQRWADRVRRSCGGAMKVMAIDDIDDRPLGAELLLDQSRLPTLGPRRFGAERDLIGPGFALLRPEFQALREASLARREATASAASRIFISTGMMDVGGAAALSVEALAPLGAPIDVAVSARASSAEGLQSLAEQYENVSLHLDAVNMGELTAAADIGVGAAGATTWERLCLGLPAALFVLAENQKPIAEGLGVMELGVCLGEPDAAEAPARLRAAVEAMLSDPGALLAMSRRCAAACDGEGAERVVDALYSGHDERPLLRQGEGGGEGELRRIGLQDQQRLLDWRNQDRVRLMTFSPERIAPSDHALWFRRALTREDGLWAVYSEAGRPLGHINAQPCAPDIWRWTFYIGEVDAPKGAGARMLGLTIAYLRDRCGAKTLLAETLPGNTASERVHEKCGFRRVDPDPKISEPHQRWRLDLNLDLSGPAT